MLLKCSFGIVTSAQIRECRTRPPRHQLGGIRGAARSSPAEAAANIRIDFSKLPEAGRDTAGNSRWPSACLKPRGDPHPNVANPISTLPDSLPCVVVRLSEVLRQEAVASRGFNLTVVSRRLTLQECVNA